MHLPCLGRRFAGPEADDLLRHAVPSGPRLRRKFALAPGCEKHRLCPAKERPFVDAEKPALDPFLARLALAKPRIEHAMRKDAVRDARAREDTPRGKRRSIPQAIDHHPVELPGMASQPANRADRVKAFARARPPHRSYRRRACSDPRIGRIVQRQQVLAMAERAIGVAQSQHPLDRSPHRGIGVTDDMEDAQAQAACFRRPLRVSGANRVIDRPPARTAHRSRHSWKATKNRSESPKGLNRTDQISAIEQ